MAWAGWSCNSGGDVVGWREWWREDELDFEGSDLDASGESVELGDLIAIGCLRFSLSWISAMLSRLGDLIRPPLEAGGLDL